MAEKDNTAMIAIISLAMVLAFLAYLVYLSKKDPIPISNVQTAQATKPPQIVYVKQPVSKEVTKTEETRPTWPHIVNHNLNEANKIYEIKIPREGMRAWSLRCRDKVDVEYSFEPSFSTYMTLSSGETINQDTNSNMSIYSIYVRSATTPVVTELELWRN